MNHHQPANTIGRIDLVDALRGFALMGLFLIHMVEYFELYWYQPEPGPIHDWMFLIFGGKAYGIFALLFGLSFYVIMENQRRKGFNFTRRFCWRLTLLAILGAMHGLLYSGDILQVLAVAGFILVWVQRWSPAGILCLAALMLLQVPLLAQLAYFELSSSAGLADPLNWQLSGATFAVLAHGSFGEVLSHNAFWGQAGKWMYFVESGRLWQLIGLFLLGYVLAQKQFFSRQQQHLKYALWGVVLALLSVFVISLGKVPLSELALKSGSLRVVGNILDSWHNLAILCLELSVFIAAYQLSACRWLLNLQAPAGRMSLSMYLLQTLIGVPLFYGYGMGLYATSGQAFALLLGIGLWLIQLVLAARYMQYFRYGPAEWLWRAATYSNFRLALRR